MTQFPLSTPDKDINKSPLPWRSNAFDTCGADDKKTTAVLRHAPPMSYDYAGLPGRSPADLTTISPSYHATSGLDSHGESRRE